MEDTSDGNYRRWFVIDFNNEFTEGHSIEDTIPQHEYENLTRACITILPELLKRGAFTAQGTIEERKERFLERSNPIFTFIKEHCVFDENYAVLSGKLYSEFTKWLNKRKQRIPSHKEMTTALDTQGYERRLTHMNGVHGRYIFGLMLKPSLKKQDLADYIIAHTNGITDETLTTLYNDNAALHVLLFELRAQGTIMENPAGTWRHT